MVTATPEDAPKDVKQTEFKVADVHEDGTVSLVLEDGRHFTAKVGDKVEVKRHATVAIRAETEDASGVPVDAVVLKVK